jgi:hypothetical protein
MPHTFNLTFQGLLTPFEEIHGASPHEWQSGGGVAPIARALYVEAAALKGKASDGGDLTLDELQLSILGFSAYTADPAANPPRTLNRVLPMVDPDETLKSSNLPRRAAQRVLYIRGRQSTGESVYYANVGGTRVVLPHGQRYDVYECGVVFDYPRWQLQFDSQLNVSQGGTGTFEASRFIETSWTPQVEYLRDNRGSWLYSEGPGVNSFVPDGMGRPNPHGMLKVRWYGVAEPGVPFDLYRKSRGYVNKVALNFPGAVPPTSFPAETLLFLGYGYERHYWPGGLPYLDVEMVFAERPSTWNKAVFPGDGQFYRIRRQTQVATNPDNPQGAFAPSTDMRDFFRGPA